MTTTEQTRSPQVGDVVVFFATLGIQTDPLSFKPPVIVNFGDELTLTQGIIDSYGQGSWLSRLGIPDRNGLVVADYGPWPNGELRTPPGSPAREEERHKALAAIWKHYGPEYSKAKADALKALDVVYGEQRDSWSAVNEAWSKNGARR